MKTFTITFDFGKCLIKTTRKSFTATQELEFYLSGNGYTYNTQFSCLNHKSKLSHKYDYKVNRNKITENFIYSYIAINFFEGRCRRLNIKKIHEYLTVTELENSLKKVGFDVVEVELK